MKINFNKLAFTLILIFLLTSFIFALDREVLFEDSFTREEIGETWTIVDATTKSTSSEWVIKDNVLMQLSNIYRVDREYDFWQGTLIYAGLDSWDNYILSAIIGANDDDGIGAIVRYVDENNYYRFIMVTDPTNFGPFSRLEKFENGERVVLKEIPEGYLNGKKYQLDFVAVGDELEVYLDGKKYLSAKDSTFKNGKVGFMAYATETLFVDDVVVTKAKYPLSAIENEQLFRDDFSRSTIGKDWLIVDDPTPSNKSNWSISNGKLKETSNIYRVTREYDFWQGTHIVAGDESWSNYELSATLSANDDDGLGAIIRYIDKDNYYRFIMLEDVANGGPFRRLEKFVDGERILLDEVKEGFNAGQEYTLQFIAFENKLEVYLDGDKILSATDDDIKNGKIGFMAYAIDSLEVGKVKVKKTIGIPSDLSEVNDPFDLKTFRTKDPTATTVTLNWSGDITQAQLNIYKRDQEDEKVAIELDQEAINLGRTILRGLEPYTDYIVEAKTEEDIVTRRFRTKKIQITRGPYLSISEPGSVTVAWGSLDETFGKVIYFEENNPDEVFTVEATSKKIFDGYQYVAKLEGLKIQTRYTYKVDLSDGAVESKEYTFISAPKKQEATFTFNVYGDTQNLSRHKEVVAAMNKADDIAFLLHQGDIVNAPIPSEYTNFFQGAQPIIGRVPFYPVRGNHDAQHHSFNDYFELPGVEDYYSFVYGHLYVVAINSPVPFGPGTEQYAWLQQDLEAHKDLPFKVAFLHYSAYSPTYADNDYDVRKYLSPLFEEYGVQLVFSGHSHVYDHYEVNDVHYVITGGGGGWEITYETSKFNAPFNFVEVHVTPEKMVIEGRRPDLNLIESFEIYK